MGLDIHLQTDNYEQLYAAWHDDYYRLHSLSRTFCNLMFRDSMVTGETELNQISRLTGVDVTPLYEMLEYPEPQGLEFHLEMADSEAEKQEILANAEAAKARLAGNINRVAATIDGLLRKLHGINDLPNLLTAHGHDTLDHKIYFADFLLDRENGYIDNSFGQDLRNFKRFLEFAKSKGSSTVYFELG